MKNYIENEAGRLVPDIFLFYKKALYVVNESVLKPEVSIQTGLLIQRYAEF